jgi:hypothetical protein
MGNFTDGAASSNLEGSSSQTLYVKEDYYRFLEEMIIYLLPRFRNDKELRLVLSQIQYHGLKKVWNSLQNLVMINDSKTQKKFMEIGSYTLSKVIETGFAKKETQSSSINKSFI